MPVMDELREVNSFVFLLQENNTRMMKNKIAEVVLKMQFEKCMIKGD